MKTTFELPDNLFRNAKAVAAGAGMSLRELFTQAIAEKLQRSCTISPCTTADFPRPAPRPAYSVLDLGKTEAVLGPMPDWQDNLASVLARLEPL